MSFQTDILANITVSTQQKFGTKTLSRNIMNYFRALGSRHAATMLHRPCAVQRPLRRALSNRTFNQITSRSTRTTTIFLHNRNGHMPCSRSYATPAFTPSSLSANELLEQLQDQYATARDEFEIATEETEKKTVYAADDRAAARQELNTLKEMLEKALKSQHGEEVKSRVGSRVRELENALTALEESALEH